MLRLWINPQEYTDLILNLTLLCASRTLNTTMNQMNTVMDIYRFNERGFNERGQNRDLNSTFLVTNSEL